MFNTFFLLMLFCTFWASTIAWKAIIHIYNTISKTITSTSNAISKWINKPHIWYINKQRKTSHGAGKYSNNLRASKNSWYNKRNYKSGRHAWRHTFMRHKSWTKPPLTNTSYLDLKIKSRKSGISKSPPPQRLDQMLRAIGCHENRQSDNDNYQYVLSYDKPDLCDNYISMEQGSADRFSINIPRHCVLGHVLLDTNPLDEVRNLGVLLYRYPRAVETRTRNPGVIIHRVT